MNVSGSHSAFGDAQHFQTIVLSMTHGAVLLGAAGEILAANPSAERILGLRPGTMAGRTTHDAEWRTIHEDGTPFPSDEHPVSVSLRTGEPCNDVVMGVHQPDDSLVWIQITTTPLSRQGDDRPYAVIATFSDVTEQRSLQEQLLQSQKVEALGQLAAGVAHDFNNMLTVIFHRTDLLLRELPTSHALRKYVSDIRSAATQSMDLTQQLLAAGRKQILQPRVVDTAATVGEALALLIRSLPENIAVKSMLAEQTWRTYVDPTRLRQVLMNLVINARDAMPAGGSLTVETRNFVADAAYVRRHPRVAHGEYVLITVSDTGSGIPHDIRTRIYDPFFTTKPTGKGTGLGLAVVRGIVEQTGGHIVVYSETGRGTTFKLYFPRYLGDVERLAANEPAAARSRGNETVLLVEDEELVRMVLRETLEESGYRVLEASGARQALQLSDAHEGAIDVLVTDVIMPDMPGPELAERIQSRRPATRVICMSGYSESTIGNHATLDACFTFLEKPVMAGDLLATVRRVLDEEIAAG